jgi:uncharacterized protein
MKAPLAYFKWLIFRLIDPQARCEGASRDDKREPAVTKQARIASPCVGVCELDEAKGFCKGCARTMEEIIAWPDSDRQQRLAILQAVNRRRREGFRTVTLKQRMAGDV